MLEPRKAAILEEVITAYTENAVPIGSRWLVEQTGFDVSAATVRNDMMALEEEGYLTHPHTSAGRVPTEKAYRYYVDHCIRERNISKRAADEIASRVAETAEDKREALKALAKTVASLAHEAVLVGFSPRDVYYTGLSYLFAHPEFSASETVINLSAVLDHLDEVMEQVAGDATEEFVIAIGSENPFGAATSVVLVRRETERGGSLFAILGPQRMKYAENIALVKHAQVFLKTYA